MSPGMCACRDTFPVCVLLKRKKAESEAQRGKPTGTLESESRNAIVPSVQKPHKNGVGTLWLNLNRLSRLVPCGKLEKVFYFCSKARNSLDFKFVLVPSVSPTRWPQLYTVMKMVERTCSLLKDAILIAKVSLGWGALAWGLDPRCSGRRLFLYRGFKFVLLFWSTVIAQRFGIANMKSNAHLILQYKTRSKPPS